MTSSPVIQSTTGAFQKVVAEVGSKDGSSVLDINTDGSINTSDLRQLDVKDILRGIFLEARKTNAYLELMVDEKIKEEDIR